MGLTLTVRAGGEINAVARELVALATKLGIAVETTLVAANANTDGHRGTYANPSVLTAAPGESAEQVVKRVIDYWAQGGPR